jgi:hypothetical protein
MIDAAHDRAHAVHRPPGIESDMQPVLHCLRLKLVEPQLAPLQDYVFLEIESLFVVRRLGDSGFSRPR